MQRNRAFSPASAFLLCLLCSSKTIACSGPPPPSIEDALKMATMVVVAEVISIEQRPAPGDTSGRYIVEDATFRVREAFNGSYVPGEVIHIISHIGPGPCGISAKNNPVGIESIGKDGKTFAPHLSGKWLIYGYGSAPYELSLTSRTKPMEFGGFAEVKALRRLTKAKQQ
jgi:hypothetical protein